jgi:hypothetical protein
MSAPFQKVDAFTGEGLRMEPTVLFSIEPTANTLAVAPAPLSMDRREKLICLERRFIVIFIHSLWMEVFARGPKRCGRLALV